MMISTSKLGWVWLVTILGFSFQTNYGLLAFAPHPTTTVGGSGIPTSFFSSYPATTTASSSSSALRYVRDQPTPPSIPLDRPSKIVILPKLKPKIRDIKSMDELQYFLEEDDRPVAIKFYAPWCKTCQRLGLHYQRLAMEWGDTVENRQKVAGPVRFASMEYGPETSRLITERLRIRGVPTLQLYHGIRKLWEESGATNVKGLKQTLLDLSTRSSEEIRALAEASDDRILENAIEESFFDSPDFLNEEW